jgi:hypothetical protein
VNVNRYQPAGSVAPVTVTSRVSGLARVGLGGVERLRDEVGVGAVRVAGFGDGDVIQAFSS